MKFTHVVLSGCLITTMLFLAGCEWCTCVVKECKVKTVDQTETAVKPEQHPMVEHPAEPKAVPEHLEPIVSHPLVMHEQHPMSAPVVQPEQHAMVVPHEPVMPEPKPVIAKPVMRPEPQFVMPKPKPVVVAEPKRIEPKAIMPKPIMPIMPKA